MYKEAWATKHSKLIRNVEVPPECRPGEMTWYQTIRSSVSGVFSNVDKCEEYHKAILVDPIYEVNPLTALVDLIIKLLLHPLSRLGEAVGKMFSGLLGNVPMIYQIPILILFSLIILFVMILIFGYKIRLPFFLGEISPGAISGGGNSSSNPAALEQEIKELKKMLCQIQPSSLPIEESSQTRMVSGVEEIKPLQYDIQLRRHDLVGEEKKASHVLPSTPSKRRHREVILTPVKGRVLSQPDILKKISNHDDDVDGVDIVDLTMKRSDSFPKSPSKNLVIQGSDSPRTAKFEWVDAEGEDLDVQSKVEQIEGITEINTGDNESDKNDFLNKVEEIFDDSNEL